MGKSMPIFAFFSAVRVFLPASFLAAFGSPVSGKVLQDLACKWFLPPSLLFSLH